MNPRNIPLTLEEKETIRRVYLEVGNQHKVAIITGHSNTTIWKVLKDYGLNKGKGGNQVAQMKVTDEQLVEAVQKMTTKEIAAKYSIHETNVLRRCKKLGIKPLGTGNDRLAGLRPNWGKRIENLKNSEKKYGECWHYISSFDAKFKELQPNFIYLETRKKGGAKRVRIKCRKCNTIIERAESTVRQKNIECDCCKKNQQLQNERIKLIRFLYALKKAKTPQTCECCGKVFYSQYTKKYCSGKCKKKQKRRGSESIRRRCRKYNVYYDPSVTSVKIFVRDQYRCKICGLMCNTEDNTWNGYFGPFSPTVDHIIPLAKGGTHTWNNVQCAHAICNSYKRDLLTV